MQLQIRPTMGRSLFLIWSSHLVIDFFTGIWPIYKTIAGIDIAKAGLIAGVSGFLGEILQLFFGYFSDRGFRKKIIILGLILASCMLWITFTDSILTSFLVLLLLMLGCGSYHPAAVGYAGLLSERKGKNILFFASGGAIGLAISQLAFTKVLHFCGGHALVLFIPVAIVILLVCFYPMSEQNDNQRLPFREFIQPLFRAKRPLLLLYIAQVFSFTLTSAFMFLLPDLMRSKECHSWLCMGGGHLCFVIGGAMLMIPTGFFCDRYGHRPILLIAIFCALLLFYGFLIQPVHSLEKSILFLTCLGGCMKVVNPIIISWGNKLVPESPSTVSSLLMGCAWCLANLGATWAGLIAKTISIDPIMTTLALMGLLLALCFFLALFVPKLNPSRLKA